MPISRRWIDEIVRPDAARSTAAAPSRRCASSRHCCARNGDGLVVNISSIAATTAVGSNIAYCAAKAGMDVMGAALARALAPAIRVLTVSPGVVDTDFVAGRDKAANDKTGGEPRR